MTSFFLWISSVCDLITSCNLTIHSYNSFSFPFVSRLSRFRLVTPFSHVRLGAPFSHVRLVTPFLHVRLVAPFSHVRFVTPFSHLPFVTRFARLAYRLTTHTLSHTLTHIHSTHIYTHWLEHTYFPTDSLSLTRSNPSSLLESDMSSLSAKIDSPQTPNDKYKTH